MAKKEYQDKWYRSEQGVIVRKRYARIKNKKAVERQIKAVERQIVVRKKA